MVKGLPEQSKEPKLISYGDHDLSFIKKLSNNWSEENKENHLAVINTAHHIANQDNSEEFNNALLSFLENLTN